MSAHRQRVRPALFVVATVWSCTAAAAEVPSPRQVLGFDPATRGNVAASADTLAYLRAVAAASNRVAIEQFGLSTDGRPMMLAIVSAAENLERLEQIVERREKTIVLITHGVHPNEVGSIATFFPVLNRLATLETPEYQRLREQLILLIVPSLNPDGADRVARWLRKDRKGARRLPFLYHRYCGHDLNRDWLFGTQVETRSVIREVHNVYKPWLTIDVHQMGRFGPRLFVPPYADPVDPAVPEDLHSTLNRLGNRVFDDLQSVGFHGVARRWVYDAWTPARAYPLYHGGLRLLLEGASADFADDIQIDAGDLWVFGTGNSPTKHYPKPWTGGIWGIPEVVEILRVAIEKALVAVSQEPFASGQTTHWERTEDDERYVVDARPADPAVAGELLARLRLGGARVSQGETPSTWFLRDAPWGRGWCRSLLECSHYPSPQRTATPAKHRLRAEVRTTFNEDPYDASTHNLAMMAGVKIERRNESVQTHQRTESSKAPLIPAGTYKPLSERPEAGKNSSWLVTQHSLSVFRQISDLTAAGISMWRLTKGISTKEIQISAGDFILERAPRPWIERLVQRGSSAAEIDPKRRSRVFADAAARPFFYPDVFVAVGSISSKDEGWLRWLLEDYQFRFRELRISRLLDESFVEEIAADLGQGRPVLLLAEGTLRHPRAVLGDRLRLLVEKGWRVVALGNSAKWVGASARLAIDEVELRGRAFPGVLLRSSIANAWSKNAEDPFVWGYEKPPHLFFDRGVLWNKSRGATSEPSTGDTARHVPQHVLSIAADDPLLCGLVDTANVSRIQDTTALLRVQEGSAGGEWVLCGFRPHYRSWTLGTVRILFNLILAP